MLLELGDMVYSSFPDLDNQMEQEEGSDFDDHSLGTFLVFFWVKGATLEEAGISALKSGTRGWGSQPLNWVSLLLPYLFLHLKKRTLNDNQR